MQKLWIVLAAGVFLGGCSVADLSKQKEAASDEQAVVATPSSTPATIDSELSSVPSPETSNEVESLEKDIEGTQIFEEDFSDLE